MYARLYYAVVLVFPLSQPVLLRWKNKATNILA